LKREEREILVLGLGLYFEEGRESLIWRREFYLKEEI